MLKIKRETDYAIRCIMYLSARRSQVAGQLQIARAMQIPKPFLSKILQRLTKTGLVLSVLGVKGGFKLAKSPARITLLDVITAIEGPVAMNICAVDRKICGLSGKCKVHPVWVKARAQAERALAKVNFGKLAGK
jgi:Rrf2 family protein